MKKIIFILLLLFGIFARPAFADGGDGSDGVEGLLDSTTIMENAFVGQKKISDEDFQKTLDAVKVQQGKRKKTIKPFVGKDYNGENTGGYINETAAKNLVLGVPLCLTNGDGTEIPIGHYKIVASKKNDKIFLDFYQSATLIARVPAIETNNDFDEASLNFVKLIPYNEQRVKVIYGSMDFNAYTFIKIKTEISDQN